MTNERLNRTEPAAWADIAGPAMLALLKGGTGIAAGSTALIADAAHSAASAARAAAVMTGLRDAKRPREGSAGRKTKRSEIAASLLVPVLLLLAGLEIGSASVKALYRGVSEPPEWYALVVLGMSVIAASAITGYRHLAEPARRDRESMDRVRERRFDAISSLVAFMGAGGAILGWYVQIPSLYILDPAAGCVISLLVLRAGYRSVAETVRQPQRPVLSREDVAELLQTVQSIDGIIAVDELSAREQGHYVLAEIKICVNPRITVQEGHDIARRVRFLLMKQFHHVSDVAVQVQPYDPGYPYKYPAEPDQEDVPTLLH